jgi:hypothetical protein
MVSIYAVIISIGSNIGIDQGVMGGLLTLGSFVRYFPEIDSVNPPPGSSTSHAATIQAITGKTAQHPYPVSLIFVQSVLTRWDASLAL